MRAGTMRHLIEIYHIPVPAGSESDPDLLTNDLLEPVENWILFDKVRASIEPAYGKEFVRFKQMQTELSVKFRIRYLAGLTADMRVIFNGVIHELIMPPINIKGRSRDMLLMCKEISHVQG